MEQTPIGDTWSSEATCSVSVFLIMHAGTIIPSTTNSAVLLCFTWRFQDRVMPGQGEHQSIRVKAQTCLGNTQWQDRLEDDITITE